MGSFRQNKTKLYGYKLLWSLKIGGIPMAVLQGNMCGRILEKVY